MRWGKAGQAKNFVLRLDNVLVHALPRALGVAVLDRFQYLPMLATGSLAVIIDIDRGKHDALHLRARFVDCLDEHLIAREPRDGGMESCIGLDESNAALPVVG